MNQLTGTSDCLKAVALGCATIADQVQDPKDDTPYTLKRITHAGGKGGFRFTAERYIDGVLCEITVKTLPHSKGKKSFVELPAHEVAELKAVPQ